MYSINVEKGEPQEKHLATGRHSVRDIFCKVCQQKVGWSYVSAISSKLFPLGPFVWLLRHSFSLTDLCELVTCVWLIWSLVCVFSLMSRIGLLLRVKSTRRINQSSRLRLSSEWWDLHQAAAFLVKAALESSEKPARGEYLCFHQCRQTPKLPILEPLWAMEPCKSPLIVCMRARIAKSNFASFLDC